jgi:agmatine deiminase
MLAVPLLGVAACQPAKRVPTTWFMPSEESPHERTWMCWPSSEDIWGPDLIDVQDDIIRIASAISRFEPVSLLIRPEEMRAVGSLLPNVTMVPSPVDDLWARDTLTCFLLNRDERSSQLGVGHVVFNGWGNKQQHDGDTQLARLLAEELDVPLVAAGLTGEGGGFEVDGAGSVLASASSWVNENRNPGKSRADIQKGLLELLGADHMVWIDGLAGADITDGHIDTLARFVGEAVVLVDVPAFQDASDPWVAVAERTRAQIGAARRRNGDAFEVVEIVQPQTTRVESDDFLATYMNYYVCNGAVVAPEFGDAAADAAAAAVLQRLFPNRTIVQVNIDALAAGGGGIHCATQQQPKVG